MSTTGRILRSADRSEDAIAVAHRCDRPLAAVRPGAEDRLRDLVTALTQLPVAVAYVALAALVAGESAGLPLPGETTLLAAAVLASQGGLALPIIVAVAAFAAIAGDNVGYLIGRRGGRRLLERPGRWEDRRRRLLVRGEAFFDRHGGKAVFLARWAPGLRVAGAWLAGMGRMRWRSFLFWNALGGVAWATVVALAGYFLGKAASGILGTAGIALLVLLGASAAGVWLFRRRVYSPGGKV